MNKKKILASRKAVKRYRDDHSQLYARGYYKGIHDAHTPLLNNMKAELKKQGFNSLDEFFGASKELNIKELGFTDKVDFYSKATQAEEAELEKKWR